jgi:ankyrin repeat protein
MQFERAPLIYAAMNGSADMIEMLVRANASVDGQGGVSFA